MRRVNPVTMKLVPAPLPKSRLRPLPANAPAGEGAEDSSLFVRVIDIRTERASDTPATDRKLARRPAAAPPRAEAAGNTGIILLHL